MSKAKRFHKSTIDHHQILGKRLSTMKIALEKIFTLKLMTLILKIGLEYMPSCWVKNQSISSTFRKISKNLHH